MEIWLVRRGWGKVAKIWLPPPTVVGTVCGIGRGERPFVSSAMGV